MQGSGHSLRGQIENCQGFVSPALAPATVDTRHVGAPGCLLARFPVQTKGGGWVWPGGGGLLTPGLEGSGHEPAARVGEEPERGVEHERSAAAAARQARAPLVCYMRPQRSSCKGCRSDDAQDVRVPLGARLIELEMRSSACPLLSNYCHRHPPLSLESVETVTVSVSPLGDGLSGH